MVGLILGGRGVEELINVLYQLNFSIKIFIAKNSRVNPGGGIRKGSPPPPRPEYNRAKNFLYHLIYVSKVYISNLRPLGLLLHVEKFVWVSGV